METKGSKKIDNKYKLELMHDDKNLTQPWINLYFERLSRTRRKDESVKSALCAAERSAALQSKCGFICITKEL